MPAAYAYLAVVAALTVAGLTAAHWQDFPAAAFFFSNYFVSDSWFTGHFWSLALEEHFYLFWPILVKFGRRSAVVCSAALIVLTVFLRWQVTNHAIPA